MNIARVPKHWSFLFLAYAISWSIGITGIALGAVPSRPLAYLLMAGLFMFGPAVAAIIQQRLIDRAPWRGLALGLRKDWWRWILLTALVGLLIVPTCHALVYIFGEVLHIPSVGHLSITQERLFTTIREQLAAAGKGEGQASLLEKMFKGHRIPGSLLLIGILLVAFLAAVTVNLPAMLGEELGWRGYLYQATAHWSAPRRVLFTGVFWGLWHAPLIAVGHNYPGHPVLGIGLMVVLTLLFALLFDWSRTRSGTVWSTCVLHGIINGSAGAFVLFAWGGTTLVASPVGAIGFGALALLNVAVLVADAGYRNYFLRGAPLPLK